MNGYEIYDKAALRLGYKGTGENGVLDARIMARSLEFINQIAADLKIFPVEDLSQKIDCSPEKTEALCCGVAMLMSLCEGDANKNVIFTAIYNAKRASVLSAKELIEDTLPSLEG